MTRWAGISPPVPDGEAQAFRTSPRDSKAPHAGDTAGYCHSSTRGAGALGSHGEDFPRGRVASKVVKEEPGAEGVARNPCQGGLRPWDKVTGCHSPAAIGVLPEEFQCSCGNKPD